MVRRLLKDFITILKRVPNLKFVDCLLLYEILQPVAIKSPTHWGVASDTIFADVKCALRPLYQF